MNMAACDRMGQSNGSRARKGFIALVDATIALFVLVSFAVVINGILQQALLSPPIELQRQGMAVLTVLEYTDSFYSPAAVFAETSDSVCMRLEVYNGTSTALDYTATKSGCPASASSETVIWRTFVDGSQLRSASLAIWMKTQ